MPNPIQIFEIDPLVTFSWLIKHVHFFDSPGIHVIICGKNSNELMLYLICHIC